YPTVNNDTLMWNAGNIGDRRPQLRLSWEPKAGEGVFSFAGAAGLTGAVDSKDLDANGVRDGEASGLPNLQARAGWARAVGFSKTRLGVGLSGLWAREKTAAPFAGETKFGSRAANLDLQAPICSWLSVAGEAWAGRNLSDFRGGIAQGVAPGTGVEVRSRG